MKKQISVIIPTYNRAEYIKQSVGSVLDCLNEINGEVIIVDDGSTDDTKKVISDLRKEYDNLIYHSIPHTGRPGAARNAGLDQATGEYIAFQDDDDIWLKDKLVKQLSALNTGSILAYGNISYIDKSGKSISDPIIKPGSGSSGYLFTKLLKIHRQPIPTSTVVVKKSAIDKAGKFNEELRLASDMEYWIRLSTIGDFAFVDEVLALVRRHDANISTISENIEGTFMDRLNQLPVYHSVQKHADLNNEQKQQMKWAEIEAIDQLKKLSGRYSHMLLKNYHASDKTSRRARRWFTLFKDACSNFIYYLKNL